MKILAIESASLTASVALLDEEVLVAEYTVTFKKTHSQTLLPMIDEIVKMIDFNLDDLDAIAISGGPGSFTGLRIGSATAKGLGLALNKPLIHVPTLEAMAYQLFETDGLICPIMDARREHVFTGIYSWKEDKFQVVKEQTHMDIRELGEELNKRGKKICFLGDGIGVYRKIIEETCKVPVSFSPCYANRARAGAVAALGREYYLQGKIETAMQHVPDYLRLSQAEQQLKEKEKNSGK